MGPYLFVDETENVTISARLYSVIIYIHVKIAQEVFFAY